MSVTQSLPAHELELWAGRHLDKSRIERPRIGGRTEVGALVGKKMDGKGGDDSLPNRRGSPSDRLPAKRVRESFFEA